MNNIIVAKTAGFCFGVNRAVEKIYKLINENERDIERAEVIKKIINE